MSSDQFWIDVKTDCSFLEKKSNVLRWSFFKMIFQQRVKIASNKVLMLDRNFLVRFFYPLVVH